MNSSRRLITLLPLLFLLVLVLTGLIYMVGMRFLEGQERSFLQAIEWAAETLSSTGYGNDTTWSHPLMVAYVVLIQFVGAFMLFLILPAYLLPILESRFELKLPDNVGDLSDHVFIYRDSAMVTTLVQELAAYDTEFAVIEPDEAAARRLLERGIRVVSTGVDGFCFEEGNLHEATLLVVNGGDDENAAAVLAARQDGYDKEILAIVEEPRHRQPLMLAGASAAYVPRNILGAALAARASRKIGPTVTGLQQLGNALQVAEIRLRSDSTLAGKTLQESEVGNRTGVQMIAQWVGGRLQVFESADDRLAPDGVLVAVGTEAGIEELERVCDGAMPIRRHGHFVVAGYGEVGRMVVDVLRSVGEVVRVVDRRDIEGADLVADVLDPGVLEELDLENAQAIVIAVDTDAAVLFSTVVVKDRYPNLPIIARVSLPENLDRMYRAGADFALSVGAVAARMLAQRILGEEIVSLGSHLRVQRFVAPRLDGRTLEQLRIRGRTGCSVVAVERDRGLLFDFGPDFRFEKGDSVFVAGRDKATREFGRQFCR